jgi:tetraacyldisaccharide 4'-kinase
MPPPDRDVRDVRAVLSGERRDPIAVIARWLLLLAALFYEAGVRLRNLLFTLGVFPEERAGRPVISVGNITAGGTGKTPVVEMLARLILERGRRPAIVSRGYGARAPGERNDEALLLSENLPDVPQVIDPVRVRGARLAVREHGADVVLLDDGFQHRHIARELDLVLVDALEPWGHRRLLPRGLLREPLGSLRRASAIVITRGDLVPGERLDAVRAEAAAIAPGVPLVEVMDVPVGLGWAGEPARPAAPVETIAGRRVLAFCGIGNPAGFYRRLEALGAVVAARRSFSDHHPYTEADVRALLEEARAAGIATLVATQKDAVKLARIPLAKEVRVLRIEARATRGADVLAGLIDAALAGGRGAS